MNSIITHTQSGGSWKKFWRGVKHATKKVGHWLVKAGKDTTKFLGDRVFTKENIQTAVSTGAKLAPLLLV
jgi:hypothetical protein